MRNETRRRSKLICELCHTKGSTLAELNFVQLIVSHEVARSLSEQCEHNAYKAEHKTHSNSNKNQTKSRL